MVPVHNLFIIIEDLIYSNNMNIDIVMPYYNKKKDVGPPLVNLLREAGLPRLNTTPQEWIILTPKGPKRLNFMTSINKNSFSDLVIIPE